MAPERISCRSRTPSCACPSRSPTTSTSTPRSSTPRTSDACSGLIPSRSSPNWRRLPVGYHGRAGTVVVSGTPVVRPWGQTRAPGEDEPTFGPTLRLDIELELGFVVGVGSPLGEPVPTSAFRDHVFGVVLVNDWSARDIQAWEYQPLGPFLGKSFATSIAAWVTPLALLEDRLRPAPAQEPAPLEYLVTSGDWALDLELEVELCGSIVSRTNARDLYWTMPQQLAHATANGASTRTGDLFASGTISGPERGSEGSPHRADVERRAPDRSRRRLDADVPRGRRRGRPARPRRRARARRGARQDPPAAPRLRRRNGERAGAVDLARERPAEDLLQPGRDRDEVAEVDPRLDPLPIERVYEVLGGDVPRRPRRERAAPEPADRGVEDARARLECSERVRVAGVTRVVEVPADRDAEVGRPGRRAPSPPQATRRRSCPRARSRPARPPPPGPRARRHARDRPRPRTDSRRRRSVSRCSGGRRLARGRRCDEQWRATPRQGRPGCAG